MQHQSFSGISVHMTSDSEEAVVPAGRHMRLGPHHLVHRRADTISDRETRETLEAQELLLDLRRVTAGI